MSKTWRVSVVRLILWCGVLVSLTALAAAQKSDSVVEARVLTASDAAHPNSSAKMAVVAQVAPGYHLNDHHPTLEYLIPTELKLDAIPEVKVKDVVYPKGTPKKFAFSDLPLSVYEGSVVVGAVLEIPRKTTVGDYTLKGKFAYQACNDHACLPPASVPIAVTVKVVRRTVLLKRLNADVFDRIQLE